MKGRLTPLEAQIVSSLHSLDAGPHDRGVRVQELEEALAGMDFPTDGNLYEAVCMMARPDLVHVPLISTGTNPGSADFGPMPKEHAWLRLTTVGLYAARAGEGTVADMPFGLINGDLHLGGLRPPFGLRAIAEGLASIEGRDGSADLATLEPMPTFPTGCVVSTKSTRRPLDGIVTLDLAARVTYREPVRTVTVDCPPPGVGSSALALQVYELAKVHPQLAMIVRNIRDESGPQSARLEVEFEPDIEVDFQVLQRILFDHVPSMTLTCDVEWEAPFVDIVSAWARILTADHYSLLVADFGLGASL